MNSRLMKRALIRDNETPIGYPGKMHIECGCGNKLPIAEPFDRDYQTRCECGVTYDGAGWIVLPPYCDVCGAEAGEHCNKCVQDH